MRGRDFLRGSIVMANQLEVLGYPGDESEPLRYEGTVIVGGWVKSGDSGVVIDCPAWNHWVRDALPEGTQVVLVVVGRSPYWSLVNDDA